MSSESEIEILIRARYPILYLLSSEEARVMAMLTSIADRQKKKLYEWTQTMGVMIAGTSIQSRNTRNTPTKDPLAALDLIIDQVDPALFVLKDFHPFLRPNQSATIRRLRDIAIQLKQSHKTVILLSPCLEIPPELEKEITLIPIPLPGLTDLDSLLDQLLVDVSGFENIQIDLEKGSRDRLLRATQGLTWSEAENVFARILIKNQCLSGEEVSEVLEEKKQIIRKNGLLEYYSAGETMASVGGLSALKDWLTKRAQAFSEEARQFGLPSPRGMLLVGVQGCGKSLCAKAVANLWGLPLLKFDMGRLFGSFVGSSEENTRRAIAVAESVAPAILWMDEIDKAFAGTQGSGMHDGGTTQRVFGTLLTWLSEKTSPVFVMATANNIAHLPPELLRKGRLDEIFFLDLPERNERREILNIHLQKRGRIPHHFDLDPLAERCANFSGAEIEQAIISGLFEAFDQHGELTTDHILNAMEQTVPLSVTLREALEGLRQWAHGRARLASGSTPRHMVFKPIEHEPVSTS